MSNTFFPGSSRRPGCGLFFTHIQQVDIFPVDGPMTCKHDEGVSERPRWHLQMSCSVTDLSSRSVGSPSGIYSRKVGDSNNDVIKLFPISRTVPVAWHREVLR